MREEIRKIQQLMEAAEYVTDAPVATSVHLALSLRKPLLIEGHAGVGKTEVAKVMSRVLGTNLIRLQCYEGLDASTALYEWNYQKQLLHIKLTEASARPVDDKEHEIFSESFLLRRPLLQAITQESQSPVLLVDEVDRCVAADTLIATERGVTRAENVRPGDELISFDPDTFRLTRATVRKVIPRETTRIVRILAAGRFLEVTPEHRFVRFTEGGHEVVHASDLTPGDHLPISSGSRRVTVDEPEFDFDDDIVKLAETQRRRLHAAYRASGRRYEDLAVDIGVSRSHLRNVLQPQACRRSLRAAPLAKLVSVLDLPGPDTARLTKRIRQSVGFYEVLGYIVADGCFTSDRLCVSDKDHHNLSVYAQKFEEAFGRRARIVRGPHRNWELTCHSLPLGRFLKRVLGPGMVRSRRRRVPDFVYSLPPEKKAGFLRGFFDGEGWVGHHQVCATSSSPYLLAGIQELLTSLGVPSYIHKTSGRKATFGNDGHFTISVTDTSTFSEYVGFSAPAKIARLNAIRRSVSGRIETLPPSLVDAALDQVRRGGVLNGRVAHQTVYDILSRKVRPNRGSLDRISREFESPALRELLQRGVGLGKVTSIEVVTENQTVYDFVLDGPPYFVANQIVTHNCDEEFEAFMLEVFAEWQVTIPEIGTVKATHPPHVILTSNRTRELSDALRRRCLYLWIDYPPFDKELRIVERKVPGINARLAREIARFMEVLRTVRLNKVPGVAESLDWGQALVSLHADHLDEALVGETLGCVLKDADDMKRFRAEVAKSGLASFLPAPS